MFSRNLKAVLANPLSVHTSELVAEVKSENGELSLPVPSTLLLPFLFD